MTREALRDLNTLDNFFQQFKEINAFPLQSLNADPDYKKFAERCIVFSSKIEMKKKNFILARELSDKVMGKIEKVGKDQQLF